MLPARYQQIAVHNFRGGSLALTNNEPLLNMRAPAGSAIRGIAEKAGRLVLVCDESVNKYEVNGDLAILTKTQLIPLQPSRIFVPPGLAGGEYMYSSAQVLQLDPTSDNIISLQKIQSLQSLDVGADCLRATNYSHYFELYPDRLHRRRLPGRTAMVAFAAAGLVFYVEQWNGPTLYAYAPGSKHWAIVDKVELIEEWHFPRSAMCKTESDVIITIDKFMYVFNRAAQKFGTPVKLQIKSTIVAAGAGRVVACDGKQVIDPHKQKVLFTLSDSTDEITALHVTGQEIWLGTMKGALLRLEEHTGVTGFLPGAAFHGPLEVAIQENIVTLSSRTHELELQCFYGGGLSLIPSEKTPNQSGSTLQDISCEHSGSRLFIRRFGELKNILDFDALLVMVVSGRVFCVDRNECLYSTDGEEEPQLIGRFSHPVRALDIRQDSLGGYTCLAADTKPRCYSLLVLNEDLKPVSLEFFKADMAYLADGLTYLVQNGRRITIHLGKYRDTLEGEFLPLQAAAIAGGLLFFTTGGTTQVRAAKRPEYKPIAQINASVDLAYLTYFQEKPLTYDKYHSRSIDRLVKAYRKNGAPVSDREQSALVGISETHGFVLKGDI